MTRSKTATSHQPKSLRTGSFFFNLLISKISARMGGAFSCNNSDETALSDLAEAETGQEFIRLADEHNSVIDRFASGGSSQRHSISPLLLDVLSNGLEFLTTANNSSSSARSRRSRAHSGAAAADTALQNELVHHLTRVLHALIVWSWKLGPDLETQWAGEALKHLEQLGFIEAFPSICTFLADRLQSQGQQLRTVLRQNPTKSAVAEASKHPMLTHFLISHLVLLYRTFIMGSVSVRDPAVAQAVHDWPMLSAVGTAVASGWRAWPVMQQLSSFAGIDAHATLGKQLYLPVMDVLLPLVESMSGRLPAATAAPADRLQGNDAQVLAAASDLQWVVMVLLTLKTQQLSRQQEGLSAVPAPTGHSSSDRAACSGLSNPSSSQPATQHARGDIMLAVPLYHADCLVAAQLEDLPGADLLATHPDTSALLHVACVLLHCLADSAQQQRAGSSRSAGSSSSLSGSSSRDKVLQFLPSFVPVLFELAALQPLKDSIAQHCMIASSSVACVMRAAHAAQGGRRSKAARAADPYLRSLAGFWQPLVQLVVPVLQHAGLTDVSTCPGVTSIFPLMRDSMEVLLELDSSQDSQLPSAHFYSNFGITCSSLEVAIRCNWSACAEAEQPSPQSGPVMLQEVGLVRVILQSLASPTHVINLVTDSRQSQPLLSLLLSCVKRLYVSMTAAAAPVGPQHAAQCVKLAVAAADITAVALGFLAACSSSSGSSGAGNTAPVQQQPVAALLQDRTSARSQWLLLAGRALYVVGAALQAACSADCGEEGTAGVSSPQPAAVGKDASGLELVPVAAFAARLADGCQHLQSVLQSAGPQTAALLQSCSQLRGLLCGLITQPGTQRHTQQQCKEQWQQLLADGDVTGQLGSSLISFGGLLCAALPSGMCCNNIACSNLDTSSELQLAAESSKCSGCRVARYCSQDCLQQHWRGHKAACRALAAAAPSGRRRGRIST